jgi:hypothetical protein
MHVRLHIFYLAPARFYKRREDQYQSERAQHLGDGRRSLARSAPYAYQRTLLRTMTILIKRIELDRLWRFPWMQEVTAKMTKKAREPCFFP